MNSYLILKCYIDIHTTNSCVFFGKVGVILEMLSGNVRLLPISIPLINHYILKL